MKKALLVLSLILCGSAFGEFRQWTSADGRTAKLELIAVTDEGGEKVGEFKMPNGTKVSLKASQLSDSSAKELAAWQPAGGPSVFDEAIDGNLLKLDGDQLKALEEFAKPSKYYLFYYTASWCGPCQRFTPSLVEFYNKNKNGEFELVLISSVRSEEAMVEYAVQKHMSWPQLKLSKVKGFRGKFSHPGGGIPKLVLCDLDGNILKNSYDDNGRYLGPGVVMSHLEGLLAK